MELFHVHRLKVDLSKEMMMVRVNGLSVFESRPGSLLLQHLTGIRAVQWQCRFSAPELGAPELKFDDSEAHS